ncbi:efflux RND transporter permease subunit [Reinekea blandensis]|uniref:Acriflavin resistance protein n=1 Tax=Reinekea blandensis MED297 TaxID=314283 RepID=A4BF70_9GAMM|nr:efflux RND transporter permease subunit [Reinekea blandensis]EAR09183.1 Acriflavin resistance protein [Reinekea sp. MED297] [Reinekea blandensis MED297]
MKTLNDRGVLAYFTGHRVAANLIMVIVVLAGLVALNRIQTQLMPDVTIPVISINTTWTEANAATVEKSLTSPLESALSNLDDIEEVWSWSSEGHSQIILRYALDADMDDAMSELTSFLNTYRDLPDGAEQPEAELEEDREAMFSLLVSTEGPVTELRPLVQQFKNDLLGRGIAEVDVRGFPDEEIRVEADLLSLVQQQTGIDQIAGRIAGTNQNSPGGLLSTDAAQVSVTTDKKNERAQHISQLTLNGNTPLGEVASVSRETREGARHYVLEGKEVVRLLIFPSPQIDSLETSDIVYQWLDDVRPELPRGVDIVVWWDMSEVVEGSLDMLISNGLVGLLLVICILFFFLNRHVAWWSAIGIPISIAGTFMLLYGTGGTINFLSVFAFLMALGIIVDDAIVVGEETVTQMEKGKPAHEAALLGAKRMFAPIIASSLTTIAAFLPLLLLPGPFGEMLRPVPVVIISVIIASLIECFLILPGHLNHGLSKRGHQRSRFRQAMDSGFNRFRDNLYRPFVTAAIHNRFVTVLLAIVMAVLAGAMVLSRTVPFSPELEVEDNMVTASVSFRDGTDESVVEYYTEALKRTLAETDDSFETDNGIVTQVYEIYSADEGFAQVQAKLVDRDDRPLSNADFLKAWGERIPGGPDVDRISTNQDSASASSGPTLSFFLAGRNLDDLTAGANALKTRLEQYAYLSDITDDLPEGGDEIVFTLTPAAEQVGLTDTQVSAQLRQALMGAQAQSFTEYDASLEVNVRLPNDAISNTAQIRDLPIRIPDGSWVRFGNIAEFHTQQAFGTVFHHNGQVGVRINAVILDEEADSNALSREIYQADVEPVLQQFGLTGEIQGTAQDIQEMFRNLGIAAIAGLLLIYFILVWVFSNYAWPFAVMSAIPFALTGAVFGHWALGMNLTFLSIFGLFGLSGIIINDSIILINRYQELRNEGWEVKPAIIDASCQRLRAVLLTSITTVGGLIPILMSDSIQAQLVQSMAASLAFGISYGTLLVLLVIPALLTYIESAANKIRQFKQWLLSRLRPKSLKPQP